jgi:glycosyltransferase involved in cell wall biosynthesis
MSSRILETAHRVFEIELEALRAVEAQLGDEFVELVKRSQAALDRGGKLVLTGIGKSGYIGKKIAATLSSIGSTAVFMHPVEALHGDLGIMRKDDLLVAISYSGETDELLRLITPAKRLGVENQVHFLGLKVHDEVWAWLDQLDIYVQPSKQEGLPRALIEAMSRGCICMGSTTAGIPELLDPQYIFNNGDVGQICEILQNIMSNQHKQDCVIRNYEKSKEFDIDLLNTRRQGLFEEYKNINKR